LVTVLSAMLDIFFPEIRPAILPLTVITLTFTITSGLDYIYRGARLLNDQ
jgi:hypothetical protein